MPRLLDKILVVDIEATCWSGPAPPDQKSDIIEFGLVLVDVATLQPEGKRSILVRPTRSSVSDFCTKLTSLTQEDVDGGVSLRTACEILMREYSSRSRLWASYGDYDRRMVQQSCEALNAKYPFNRQHLNVKTLFAVSRGLPQEYSMANALASVGLPLEGTHHRGHDDAWNIAGLLAHTLKNGREIVSNR